MLIFKIRTNVHPDILHARQKKNVNIVKYLIDNRKRYIDVNYQDDNKWTPLHYAY
ncbi:hypothetical protein BCR36DRAFT_363980 [Piromyces finnis]|uniref:Ankyrin n=1 Tax=Piromyces finnis TaxID=1754191 RepID=A0A1Y1UUI4_9FUNG|nr:hypothetical protein BCR36DRAFT_363980 [Piromyces finnis]|eukprot:ORX41616.1 hypothetical protein BCR36DRAFT_363980 [Piromyces finnis]